MRWRDALGLALRAVSRRFGRASLTLLAVALATALLTALVVIAATAKTRVIGQLTKGGPLASIRVQGSNLDQDSLRLIQKLPSVKAVAPVVVARWWRRRSRPRTARGRGPRRRPRTSLKARWASTRASPTVSPSACWPDGCPGRTR